MLHLGVFILYSLFSALFLRPFWPVWNSAIPGGLEDTRLFLWNAWWFQHALDTLHTNPYFTSLLFHPFGASLVSHDFPLWNSLITYTAQAAGLPLVGASNLWFVLSWILAGFCSYLLAWEITRSRGPAIVAGLYVMTHSYTLARAMQNWGQFNLYGIALFLWLFLRSRRTGIPRDSLIAGLALAWTAACHYYFLIYSGAIWLAVLIRDFFPWKLEIKSTGAGWRFLLVIAVLAGAIAAWILLAKPQPIRLGGSMISFGTPTNALLVMWLALGAWIASHFKVRLFPNPERRGKSELVRQHAWLVGTALVCLSPLLVSAALLAFSGNYPQQSILWKTHLPGANLLALFMPNPLHTLWGNSVSQWFYARGMQPQEQAASIGWVCLAVVVWSGLWKRGAKDWFVLGISSTVLAMGVYLHIAQWNLWLPLPFYVWRLLPVLGNVRVPERWMAVGAIAWGVVLALALVALARQRQWKLSRVCLIAGILLLMENWPGIPLGQPPADQPVYQLLKKQPLTGVLPVPIYIGDSSIGAGDAPAGLAWEYLGAQIYHQHPIAGGYLGRISKRMIRNYKEDPFFNRLIDLEEEKSRDSRLDRRGACQSLKSSKIDFILLYRDALKPAIKQYISKLPLRRIGPAGPIELHRIACP